MQHEVNALEKCTQASIQAEWKRVRAGRLFIELSSTCLRKLSDRQSQLNVTA